MRSTATIAANRTMSPASSARARENLNAAERVCVRAVEGCPMRRFRRPVQLQRELVWWVFSVAVQRYGVRIDGELLDEGERRWCARGVVQRHVRAGHVTVLVERIRPGGADELL